MTFYTFENSELSDANQVNANFNELTYAILYNRMENDAQATAPQLNANIQSDLFCCAAGKYSTVCTAGTTSTFSTNNYQNYCIDYTFCYNSFTTTCCQLIFSGCPVFSILLDNNNCTCICAYNALYGTNESNGCVTIIRCASLDFTGYYSVTASLGATYWLVNDGSYCCTLATTRISFNGDSVSCNCVWTSYGAICRTYSNNYTFNRIPDTTCFCFCKNGAGVCVQNSNAPVVFEICSSAGFRGMCAFTQVLFCHNITGLQLSNTKIQSNLKTYATPKGSVVLSTVANLPAGNCIRYNIKDQAGTVLLCDASPDAVYSLSSPANCLYAEIYQCVECNLCTPQCMTQYALMYM